MAALLFGFGCLLLAMVIPLFHWCNQGWSAIPLLLGIPACLAVAALGLWCLCRAWPKAWAGVAAARFK